MTTAQQSKRALAAMRDQVAAGWYGEALLVDHAAAILGDTDEAKQIAKAVFDKHYKIMGAN